MNKLGKKSFEEIRSWIYRNARQVDLSLWQYEFENGSKEAVLSALSHYQNADGGFGNALEPDCWNPNSSPYTTLCAIGRLNDIGFTDASNPIIGGIFKFLESSAHNENGWPFSIPSNNDFPRAPWWTYDEKANEYESIGVSAGIACFLLTFADEKSELYNRALSIAKRLIAKLHEPGNYGDMGLTGYCMLLNSIKQTGLADQFDMEFLSDAVKKHVDEAIVRDETQWSDYCVRPSQFISSPDSPFISGNEDIIQKELDYLIKTRPENGVWGITWQWFDHYEKYPKEFALSENWWMASGAIDKLKLLRRFDRLQ